jgi:sec-independent protein translocase protein TatB
MFGIDSSDFLVIVIIAVIVIGPKDLPRALYKVGQIGGKAQGMARHFRTGIDAMVREVELEELEKKWAEQNKRIMAEHPPETQVPETQVIEHASASDAPSDPVQNEKPPYVAEAPAVAVDAPPYVAEAAPPPVADKPPYVAEEPVAPKQGDAAA